MSMVTPLILLFVIVILTHFLFCFPASFLQLRPLRLFSIQTFMV